MKVADYYIRPVVPDFADTDDDWRYGNYSAWFVGSLDETKVTDDAILKLFAEWRAEDEEVSYDTESFFGWLEQQPGYVVFNSVDNGWCTIPFDSTMDEILEDQEDADTSSSQEGSQD